MKKYSKYKNELNEHVQSYSRASTTMHLFHIFPIMDMGIIHAINDSRAAEVLQNIAKRKPSAEHMLPN